MKSFFPTAFFIFTAINIYCADNMPMRKSFRFSKNRKWLTVNAPLYNAVITASGAISVKSKPFTIEISFIEIWKKYQFFPHVKYVEANLIQNPAQPIEVRFSYFWNDGKVDQKMLFGKRQISFEYIYTPLTERKKTRNILCLFKFVRPASLPENTLISGIDRADTAYGALRVFKKWQKSRGLLNVSLRNTGGVNLDFLAEGNAWFMLWKWPRMAIIDNGEYPLWNKVIYSKGEPKIIKFTIEFTPNNGNFQYKSTSVSLKCL